MTNSVCLAMFSRRTIYTCLAVLTFLLASTVAAHSQTTFTASAPNVPITINDNTTSSPYPSTVSVSGLTGTINKVTVSLTGVTHTDSDEVDIMLVNPAQTHAIVLMSDTGNSTPMTGFNMTFDDGAATTVPTGSYVAGTYKPTNITTGDVFAGATPTTANITSLSDFIGTAPNGTWSLYVLDDQGGDVGSITGWSITITTGSFHTGGAITINQTGAATPYPSTITVASVPGAISKLTVRLIGFAHTRPDDVGVLLVSPAGAKIRLMTDVGGGSNLSNVSLTFEDAAANLMPENAALTTTAYRPTFGTIGGGGTVHPVNFTSPAPAAPYSTTLADVNGASPNGVWSLYVDDDANNNTGSIASWALSFATLAPTAAPTSVFGRVLTKGGNGISRVTVTVQNIITQQTWTTTTNQLGYYNVDGIPAGEVYMITVSHPKYVFLTPSQTLSVVDVTEVNFDGEWGSP